MGAKIYGGRWKIQGGTLDEGGQAHVYQVIDLQGDPDDRFVLKRLKNVKRLDRFQTEADAINGVRHPNVIKLVASDVKADPPYIVMEYCAGGNLAKRSSEFEGDPLGALDVFLPICEGVAAAHEVGITHRDLKPQNILFRTPEGPPVVADFGICYVDSGERQTLLDEAVGARHFTAPELEAGRADEVGPTSDVYSLGKLLYWMISGGRYLPRESHREIDRNLAEIFRKPVRESFRFEHINRLLDVMITEERYKRLSGGRELVDQIRHVRGLIKDGYRIVTGNRRSQQRCTYCGQGFYRIEVQGEANAVRSYGIEPIGGADWRILVCTTCGHVQLFRADKAGRREWWSES